MFGKFEMFDISTGEVIMNGDISKNVELNEVEEWSNEPEKDVKNHEQEEHKELNTLDYISSILKSNGYGENIKLEHIEYNKDINDNYDFKIIRSSKHDGTLLFTLMLIDEVLLNVINKKSCHIDYANTPLKDISYEVGDIDIQKSFEGGKQVDVVSLPVKCNYVF